MLPPLKDSRGRWLIVLNIGYSMGTILQDAFPMLAIMAVVTNLMSGPMLRPLLLRMGHVVPRGIAA